jgi:hypothetical protein
MHIQAVSVVTTGGISRTRQKILTLSGKEVEASRPIVRIRLSAAIPLDAGLPPPVFWVAATTGDVGSPSTLASPIFYAPMKKEVSRD